jgi:hypothetical protein
MCDCDREVIGWRVWYERDVYDSKKHGLSDLPDDGLQKMRLYYCDGRQRDLSGADYYWIAENETGMIYATDSNPPDPMRYPGAIVIRGKWTSEENLYRIEQEADSSACP